MVHSDTSHEISEERARVFLSCGDALFDLFLSGSSKSGDTANSGDTISAVTLHGDVGGSPLNVAFGLARLGHDARYLTKLSSDPFGARMRQFLTTNNVDSSLCIDTDLNTTLAIVETQEDGSANYVFVIDNTADVSLTVEELPQKLTEAIQVLHFASYSTVVPSTSEALGVLAERERNRRIISYDPNLRPSIEPDLDVWRKAFLRFASSADFIKASDEDIEALYGNATTLNSAGREDRFVSDCFGHGAQLVLITRGAEGVSGYNPDGSSVHRPGIEVDVVDTVGAGDTIQAAMLHWLATEGHLAASTSVQPGQGATEEPAALSGEVDLAASIDFAIRAAAITCGRSGADLPYRSELG